MEVTQSELVETSSAGQLRSNWETVDGLEETADHVFVFLNTGQAYVIPRRSVVEGNLDEFLQTLREHFEGGTSSD